MIDNLRLHWSHDRRVASKPGSYHRAFALVSAASTSTCYRRSLRCAVKAIGSHRLSRCDHCRSEALRLLATQAPSRCEAQGLVEAIELERSLLDPVKDAADLVIDTTALNIHQLKSKLIAAFDQSGDGQRLQIAIESFGYKFGLPLDADIIMDVRFLPNPHWEDSLRPLTGHDPAVRDFVLERSHASHFLDEFESMMVSLVPAYEAEKTYLPSRWSPRRHRSVAVADTGSTPSCRGIAVTGASRHRSRTLSSVLSSYLTERMKGSTLMPVRVGINAWSNRRNFFRRQERAPTSPRLRERSRALGRWHPFFRLLRAGGASVHGQVQKDGISVDDDLLKCFGARPEHLPWGELGAMCARFPGSHKRDAAAGHLAPRAVGTCRPHRRRRATSSRVNHKTSTQDRQLQSTQFRPRFRPFGQGARRRVRGRQACASITPHGDQPGRRPASDSVRTLAAAINLLRSTSRHAPQPGADSDERQLTAVVSFRYHGSSSTSTANLRGRVVDQIRRFKKAHKRPLTASCDNRDPIVSSTSSTIRTAASSIPFDAEHGQDGEGLAWYDTNGLSPDSRHHA